jgi:hypothetical protein
MSFIFKRKQQWTINNIGREERKIYKYPYIDLHLTKSQGKKTHQREIQKGR